ncbi:hypothetical protein HYX05_00270 [Candidatus Woesearchaeota archaeon]|nr:hypothetical protein [Candidatus Woesearchaeota archaeon]
MNYKIPRSLTRKGSKNERVVVELIKRCINIANSQYERRHPLIRRLKSNGRYSAPVTNLDVIQVTNPRGRAFENLGQRTIEYRIETSQHGENKIKVVVHANGPIAVDGKKPAGIDLKILELVEQGLLSHHYQKSGTGPYRYTRLYQTS